MPLAFIVSFLGLVGDIERHDDLRAVAQPNPDWNSCLINLLLDVLHLVGVAVEGLGDIFLDLLLKGFNLKLNHLRERYHVVLIGPSSEANLLLCLCDGLWWTLSELAGSLLDVLIVVEEGVVATDVVDYDWLVAIALAIHSDIILENHRIVVENSQADLVTITESSAHHGSDSHLLPASMLVGSSSLWLHQSCLDVIQVDRFAWVELLENLVE